MRISEQQFREALHERLLGVEAEAVTGPGRSGAIAAVYTSYTLHIPYVPYGSPFPGKLLVIDTVSQTGKTIRKAESKCSKLAKEVQTLSVYSQQERLHFWYEDQL